MISKDIQHQISLELKKQTNISNWFITGPKIKARECVIYKATNNPVTHTIAIKIYNNKINNKLWLTQYDALVRASKTLNTSLHEYFVPNVFGSLSEEGIFMMEWINAPSLSKRLWGHFYSISHMHNDLRRSYSWLKEFHKLSTPKEQKINIVRYKKILQKHQDIYDEKSLLNNPIFKNGKKSFDRLILEFRGVNTPHAEMHGDFTPSNILINDNRVTSIDMFHNRVLPIANDIALLLSYISVEYPNILTRSDFKHPPLEWPILKLIFDAYGYPKDPKQIRFFLLVFLYELLRRWLIINHRNNERYTPLLDRWRLRNTEMIVKNLSKAIEDYKL